MKRLLLSGLCSLVFAGLFSGCASLTKVTDAAGLSGGGTDSWASFLTVAELDSILAEDPNVLVIDARSEEEYDEGHIPGAISLPGSSLRTSKASPGAGDSQYIFRAADGSPDIARYEELLGAKGIGRQQHVVVYGNHGGKADGTIPAMILSWLGQKRVSFLDGVGLDAWSAAGKKVSTAKALSEPVKYEADPSYQFVWNLNEVVAAVANNGATFVDTRSTAEYRGSDPRSNNVGGHIPGAVQHDFAQLLASNKTVVSKEEARKQLAELGITDDKPIVMYCQTATRVSLNYLVLKELGYINLHIYDASWHEYGNTEGTPVEQ